MKIENIGYERNDLDEQVVNVEWIDPDLTPYDRIMNFFFRLMDMTYG